MKFWNGSLVWCPLFRELSWPFDWFQGIGSKGSIRAIDMWPVNRRNPNEFNQSMATPLRWRHNEHGGVSNHQPHHCLLYRLFGCRSKKTSKLGVTGLCAGNSPGTGEFPAQMASNAEMFPFDDVIMLYVVTYLYYMDPPELLSKVQYIWYPGKVTNNYESEMYRLRWS